MLPLQLSISAAARPWPRPQPQALPMKVETALLIGPPSQTQWQMP